MEATRDLYAERQKNLPKNIDRTKDSLTINGGIGDGVNSGGPAYHICTDCPVDAHTTSTQPA